jgi:D-alanine-D-alanine ligase
MGPCGENGNIMGLADLLNIPIIGCGILASSLALDKFLSKLLADKIGVPVVDYHQADRDDDPDEILKTIEKEIGFPCFVKPTNLGTCAHIFRADSRDEFRKKWKETIRENHYSDKYLIEKFVPNVEVRVFVYENSKGELLTNDQYNTTLIEKALIKGGGLFDHVENKFPEETRDQIKKYARRIFRIFGMKDYARVDFFVENGTGKIYFNEANTQPFISTYNVRLMEEDGYSYPEFLHSLIKKNLRSR